MKRILALLAASFVLPLSGFASTPAPLPPNLPPLRIPPLPHVQPQPKLGPPVSVWTPEMIHGLQLSGTVTQDLLMHLFPEQPPLAHSVAPATAAAPSTVSTLRSLSHPRLEIGTNTSVVGAVQADNDANQDIEPAIITNRYTENGGTVDRTTTVFTKWDNNSVPSHWWTSTTDFSTFIGAPTGNQLPITAPANRSSDPMLSENPYSACIGCPIANPKRTYAVGVSYNLNGPNGGTGDTQLTVWYTDHVGDPIYPWTPIVVNSGFNPLFFDKPSIWTSWDITHGTLGYTYIAVVLVHLDTGYHDIQVYRQTTGTHFDLVHAFQFLNSTVTSPIITVDSATGDVYVLWLDTQYATISIARSTNMGNDFGSPVAFTAQSLITGGCNDRICNAAGSVCERAATTLMARPNAADNSIGVVWHLRESDNLHTDMGFNRFQLLNQQWTNYRGRPLGHPLEDRRDQFNPALDPANDGTYMTVWYDKRNDPNNNLYQLFGCKIGPDGTPVDGVDTMVYNNVGADPTALTALGELRCGAGFTRRYMGEYQDVWYWYGTWYGATTYIANNQQDVYLTRITP